MLAIFITLPQIKAVKRDLLYCGQGLELVSSSHLTEALAFAFGFNTNAAMLTGFKNAKATQCMGFCAERFWCRLSELTGTSVSRMQSVLKIDLPESVSRAVAIRDLREKIALPSVFKNHLDKFFELMADHGADYFTLEGGRPSPNYFGLGGSYSRGRQAMRPCCTPAKPSLLWQWDDSGWSALLADDFLEDHTSRDCDLARWAMDAWDFLEPDLRLGKAVFSARFGLVVHHEEIQGCTASILYQRPGQLEQIRIADAQQAKLRLLSA